MRRAFMLMEAAEVAPPYREIRVALYSQVSFLHPVVAKPDQAATTAVLQLLQMDPSEDVFPSLSPFFERIEHANARIEPAVQAVDPTRKGVRIRKLSCLAHHVCQTVCSGCLYHTVVEDVVQGEI